MMRDAEKMMRTRCLDGALKVRTWAGLRMQMVRLRYAHGLQMVCLPGPDEGSW